MKYIDVEKLKSIIKVQIKERKEWMKDIDRTDRQDQLWSDLNGEDMSILQIINSLQQEQPEVDLEKVVMIDNVIMNMTAEGYNNGYKTRPFYEEVLRRFNENRK